MDRSAPCSLFEPGTVTGSCPLCGSVDPVVIYDLTRASSADAVPGTVLRCGACGMWFKRLLDGGAIPTAYPGEHGGDAVARTYLQGPAARALFRSVLQHVKRSLGAQRPRLLDVGAGDGTLLEEAHRLGFDAQGIDHCQSNVEAARARGLDVRLGAAEDLGDRAAFDAVTMMDILEHVSEPMRILASARRALKPGGELVVYTPNHRAVVVKLARLLHHFGVTYPVEEIFGRNHVCFFDDRSLPRAIEAAGFQMRSLEQLPYDPARPGQEISPLNLAVVTLVERLGRPFGRGFRMLAYAQRPCDSVRPGPPL